LRPCSLSLRDDQRISCCGDANLPVQVRQQSHRICDIGRELFPDVSLPPRIAPETPFGFRVRINPTHQFFGKVKFQPMGGSGWAALESRKLLF
jgi:hypothetical protein